MFTFILFTNNHLTSNPIEMVWDELDRRVKKKSSHLVLSIGGNFFKTVGKAFLMKLVERMLSGYFEESQI